MNTTASPIAFHATRDQARESLSGMLVSNGSKTHLPSDFIHEVHAEGCENYRALRAWNCSCESRWVTDSREAACGATNNASRTSMRYASRPAGFVADDGTGPTCAKCAKRAAKA